MESKLRLQIAYNGDAFHGWARQEALDTVQARIETALEVVLRTSVSLVVAGRTDAGVHALGQVAHFSISTEKLAAILGITEKEIIALSQAVLTEKEPDSALSLVSSSEYTDRALKRFTARINKLLRSGVNWAYSPLGTREIVIKSTEIVPSEFDARFSALWREYEYVICDDVADANPLIHNITYLLGTRLDVQKMHQAAQSFLGEHDFLPFAKPREGASTVRTLLSFQVERHSDGLIRARIRADAFCHSQVRFMMGALIQIGAGRRCVTWIADLLVAKERNGTVPLAPGTGLTLVKVAYPDPCEYAEQAQRAKVFRG